MEMCNILTILQRAFLSWRFYFDAFVAGISVFVVVTALLRENVAWVLGLNVFLLRQVLMSAFLDGNLQWLYSFTE